MQVRFTPIPNHHPLITNCATGYRLAQFLNNWAVVPLSLVRDNLQPSEVTACKAARWLTAEERHRLVADIELDEVNKRTIERWPCGSMEAITFKTLAYAKAWFVERKAWLETPFDEAVRQAMRAA